MLNLLDLEQAFSEISNVGKGTIECEVDGNIIVLSALLPHEEVAVQKFAATALEENKEALSANTDFLDRFQMALLSYAIVRVGNVDLTGVETIDTGETLPNGVKVKIPRNEAVRKMVTKWSRIVRQYLFRKYSDLLERIDAETDKVIRYEPIDLDAEIDRAEARINDLKERKKARDNEMEARHPFRQQVEAFSNQNLTEPEPAPEPQVAPKAENSVEVAAPITQQPSQPSPETKQKADQVASSSRAPIIPSAVPPPAKHQKVAPSPTSDPSPDEVLRGIEQGLEEAEGDSGLMDLQEEIEAENARLLRARAAQQQSQSALRRPPPHAAIHKDFEAEDENPTTAQKVGDLGGTDAYRLNQPVTLTNKQPTRSAQGVVLDQGADKGTQNPRFRRG